MDSAEPPWVDQLVLLRLLDEYWKKHGKPGASKIERNILDHTKEVISRKTLENWLNGRGASPTSETLAIVGKFLRTEHFQQIVPRAADLLDAEARLYRIGSALFDLHGSDDKKPSDLDWLNKIILGWWGSHYIGMPPSPTGFIYIAPVAVHPFSKICLWLPNLSPYSDHPPRGSGIVFPKAGTKRRNGNALDAAPNFPGGSTAGFPKKDSLTDFAYAAHLWLNEDMQERPMKIIYHRDKLSEELFVHHQPRESPRHFVLESFRRIEEETVPGDIRKVFKDWCDDAIPRGSES